MIEILQLEETTFTEADQLLEFATELEENTRRVIVRLQDLSLDENGVRIGETVHPINKQAFKQLMKLSSMNWGGSYFNNAPTDLILSDFERMKNLNPELQCRLVFNRDKIVSVLPQDLVVAPYDTLLSTLDLDNLHFATIGDRGLRLTYVEHEEIKVTEDDVIRFGKDFVYSNTNWSKVARFSPYLFRYICSNGTVGGKNSSIFKTVQAQIPRSGDVNQFFTKLREGQDGTSIDTERILSSFESMRNNKLRDLEDGDKYVKHAKYWLTKEVFEQNPEVNLVYEDKIIPNMEIPIYSFFNEITDMAKQVNSVRRRKTEELAGKLVVDSLELPVTTRQL